MSIQITVHPPSGTGGAVLDTQFDTETVTIGRSPDAHVCLADTNRIVSKQHAEIRWTDEGYQLVDLGSKNFTFLDEVQLQAGRPYALSDGATVQVGDFTLTLHLLPDPQAPPSPASAYEETVFAADFKNPFADPVADLVRALSDIAEAYDDEAPARRDDALHDAASAVDERVAVDHPGVSMPCPPSGLPLGRPLPRPPRRPRWHRMPAPSSAGPQPLRRTLRRPSP